MRLFELLTLHPLQLRSHQLLSDTRTHPSLDLTQSPSPRELLANLSELATLRILESDAPRRVSVGPQTHPS